PASQLPMLDHKRVDFSADAEGRVAVLEGRCKALEDRNKVIIQDYQTVLGKLAQTEENFAKHKAHIADLNAAQDEQRRKGFETLTSEVELLRNGCAKLDQTV